MCALNFCLGMEWGKIRNGRPYQKCYSRNTTFHLASRLFFSSASKSNGKLPCGYGFLIHFAFGGLLRGHLSYL